MAAYETAGRYRVGLALLFAVVLIWVGSSYLMHSIFGEQAFNKPFFITYVNTASLSLHLVIYFVRTKFSSSKAAKNAGLSGSDGNSNSDSNSNGAEASETAPLLAPVRAIASHSIHRSPSTLSISVVPSSAATQSTAAMVSAGIVSASSTPQPQPQSTSISTSLESGQSPLPSIAIPNSGSDPAFLAAAASEPEAESDINLAPLTFVETAKVSAAFCLTWFAANSASNSSLAYTTVANSTILSSTSGIFTLMLGAYVGTESFVVSKLAAVASSFIGVYLVCNATPQQASIDPTLSLSSVSSPSSSSLAAISAMNEITPTMIGNGLALLGAVLYAAYTTLLKVRVGDERRINTPLFLGMVGVFNTVFLWLWLALMHYTGIEPFEWPPSAHIWGMIIVNALIGTFLSDLCWMLAMLMTSPLVTTLGLSLTIPLALFGDVVFKHAILPPSYWVGSFLVVIGFIAINLSEQQIEDAISKVAIWRRIPTTAASDHQ